MSTERTELRHAGGTLAGIAVAVSLFVGMGTVSALWENPFFDRETPATASEVALLAVFSFLFGVYVAIRRTPFSIGTAAAGGTLGLLGIACRGCEGGLFAVLGNPPFLDLVQSGRTYIVAVATLAVLAAVLQEWLAGNGSRPAAGRRLWAGRARPHRPWSDYLLTFHRWLARPQAIGMVVPSSAGLTNAMVGAAITGPQGTVVEFGSGTGVITSALLAAGLAPGDLVLVEQDAAFHRHLVERFPGARIIFGDAADTEALTEAIGKATVTAIVSALPLLAMNRREIRAIFRTANALLSADAVFVQYTYGRRSPIPEDILAEFGFEGERLDRVWLNVPPATCWRYRRRSAQLPAAAETPGAGAFPRDAAANASGD